MISQVNRMYVDINGLQREIIILTYFDLVLWIKTWRQQQGYVVTH